MGRRGGGMRGGGMRLGGGSGRMGGSRSGSGRIGGLSGGSNRGGGLGRAPASRGGGFTPRPAAPPRRGGSGLGGFGLGLGAGLAMGGRRRRGWGFGPRMGWGGGWGFGRRRAMGPGMMPGAPSGCGCSTIIVIFLVVLMVLALISIVSNISMPFVGGGGIRTATIAPSTVNREALPRTAAQDNVPMFTDHLGWIRNENQLLGGLRAFHDSTGVRPHLYITGIINGSPMLPTMTQLENFANATYDRLFNDEAHVLVIFFENANHERAMYVLPGSQAASVMDFEARGILMDFIDRYYYDDRLTDEEMFNRAFRGAGTRIMTVTRSAWIPVLVVIGVLLIVAVLFTWWRKKQEQKNLEAEQTERILSQTLDTFGDNDEASILAKQYEENEN